MSERGEEEGEQ